MVVGQFVFINRITYSLKSAFKDIFGGPTLKNMIQIAITMRGKNTVKRIDGTFSGHPRTESQCPHESIHVNVNDIESPFFQKMNKL
jgi:hypothetical protein